MTPHELRTIGEALYGPRWQSALAHAIGMAPRQMRYLAAEERPITPFVEAHILRHAAERAASLIKQGLGGAELLHAGLDRRGDIWQRSKSVPPN